MSWSDASSRPSPAERRRRLVFTATLVAVLLAAGAPASAQRMVVLPPENLSGNPEAAGIVSALVETEVAARGWDFVAGERVERKLAEKRIRRLDALPAQARESLLVELGADAYLATTVYSFRAEQVPLAAVGVRLIAMDGQERFNQVIGLSTEDTLGALATDPDTEVEPLVNQVIKRLFRRFPDAGKKPRQRRKVDSPAKLHKPWTFRSPVLDELPSPHRVAVLPFRNFTRHREASRIAAQLAGQWLDRAEGFAQVDPGDLRQALIAEKVRDPLAIGPERLTAVAGRIGSTLFLRGTVYEWKLETPAGSRSSPPEVEINLTLVDAGSARILWSSQHLRRGDQYRGLLGLGAITNVVALADRVIGEMVAAEKAARPVEGDPLP